MKHDYAAVALRVKEARNQNKITQQELADYIGVSVSYVKNIERGGKPSIEFLVGIAKKCLVSIDWLLMGDQGLCAIPLQTQKVEAVFDPDLKSMIDVLKELMESDDPDLRGWAKIQFKNAFKEHCAAIEEKKQHA